MKSSQYVKVALFFILLGTGGGAYIILSSDGLNRLNTVLYELSLPDATGLSTRSKVYLAGVAVGKIHAITLAGREAHLTIALLREVAIRSDATVARKASSILGTSILTLEPGTEHAPLLPPGGRLKADRNQGDMQALMGTVQDLGGRFSGLLQEVQTNHLALLQVSLETFNALAEKLDERADAELDRISRILESVALIAAKTEELLEEREGDIAASAEEIRGALEHIRAITGEIRSGGGTLGQVIYDDRLYHALLGTAARTEDTALKLGMTLDTVRDLTLTAQGVLDRAGEIVDRAAGLGIQIDTQARYDLLAERFRTGASLRLEPASGDRWYRIGVHNAPEGLTSRTIKTTINEKGEVASEDSTETRFSFAVDVELARRFGFLTIRGGLLENTPGFGVDLHPLGWLSLSGELFDFKTGAAPRLRGVLTCYPFFDPQADKPWNWLYIQGGITNALGEQRDFFVGGGLRFADREVKGLVGLIPAVGP
ncbi:MAG: MlaD family protein [Treponema sp.]|jgi:phospholipid/cholesterol/gamma-HCH transport system substrate-binding protein|nr:MlaD family protein [Treponema sp.]